MYKYELPMCAVMFVIGFLNNVIINSVIDVQKYKKIIKLSGSDIYIVFVIFGQLIIV